MQTWREHIHGTIYSDVKVRGSSARSVGCCIRVCRSPQDFILLFPPPLTHMELNLCFQMCHVHPTDNMGVPHWFALAFFGGLGVNQISYNLAQGDTL